MERMELERAITLTGMQKHEVAAHLFPGNKYPYLALRRVVRGKSNLDSAQMSKLAALAGIEIQDLYGDPEALPVLPDPALIVIETARYRATIDLAGQVANVFSKSTLGHASVACPPETVLTDLLQEFSRLSADPN